MDRAGAQAGPHATRFSSGPISMAPWCFVKQGVLELGSFSCPSAVLWIAFAALFQGAIYTGALLCQFRLIQIYTPVEGRTVAMALHCSIVGFGGALGAMSAGFIKDALPSGNLSFLPGHFYSFDFLVLFHTLLVYAAVFPLSKSLQARTSPRRLRSTGASH